MGLDCQDTARSSAQPSSAPTSKSPPPEVRDDHAAYIATWLKALRDDKRLIFTAAAAAAAQRAADYLHGLQPRTHTEPVDERAAA